MFSREIHEKTGKELAIIADQIGNVSDIIQGAFPQTEKIYRLAGKLRHGPGSPVFDIRDHLDNLVHIELPKSGAARLYFPLSQYVGSNSDMIGVPRKLFEKFNHIQEKKRNALPARRKPRLTQVEVKAMMLCLKHCGDRISVIAIGIVEHYGSRHKAVAAADKTLQAIHTLINELAKLHR